MPEKKNPNRIPSLFHEIENRDSVMYLNANPVGDIHALSLDSLSIAFRMDMHEVSKLKEASLILLRNDIGHILREYCGWYYVHRLSNDRGQFRPLLYAHSENFIQSRVDSCEYEIIDRKGEIVLFKQ